jgi:hypothetical protein
VNCCQRCYSKNISSKPNVATKSIGTNTDELMFASLNQQTVNNLVTTTPIKQQLHHSNEQNSIFDNDSFKDDVLFILHFSVFFMKNV